jgi:hypothetical protein
MKIDLKKDNNFISDFELLVEIGQDLSQQFHNVYAPNRRMGLSTQVLAKLMENCFSILKLLPGSILSRKRESYVDFSSIASLARNLIEASNIHWYISIEKLFLEEENLRLLIYDYHDTSELIAIVRQLKFQKTDLEFLENQLTELKANLDQNPFFKTIDGQRRNLIIKGRQGTLLTQYEIAHRRRLDLDKFKGMYKLLSNQTHTSASSIKMLGFSKVNDKKNEFNIILSLLTIEYCNRFLADTILRTGSLWRIRFAKKDSAKIVRKYSRRLVI